jgi:hypothetical protein
MNRLSAIVCAHTHRVELLRAQFQLIKNASTPARGGIRESICISVTRMGLVTNCPVNYAGGYETDTLLLGRADAARQFTRVWRKRKKGNNFWLVFFCVVFLSLTNDFPPSLSHQSQLRGPPKLSNNMFLLLSFLSAQQSAILHGRGYKTYGGRWCVVWVGRCYS